MENYIVSARKYRPTTFGSVVGQETLTQTLKNAIAADKLAHAYLFCGPRGVGKTTCARIFAKTINCTSPTPDGEACNECESCRSFNEQRSYNILELDAASNNSVDDIRTLIEQVRIPPQIGKYKVFIIDEVHMLSTAAFNAFLKTLEEPPKHVIFILATTEKHKIIPTILSRCQIYDFQRMTIEGTVRQLRFVADSEGIRAEDEALAVIARKSDGGMRDALSMFDQIAAFSGGNITYKETVKNLNILDSDSYFDITDAFLKGDVPKALLILNDIIRRGFDAQYFVSGLSEHLRNLLVSKDPSTIPLLETGRETAKRYEEQAAACTNEFLYAALELANKCDLNYRTSNNKRLLVELTLIQISQLGEKKKSDSVTNSAAPLRSIVPEESGNPDGTETGEKTPQTQKQATASTSEVPVQADGSGAQSPQAALFQKQAVTIKRRHADNREATANAHGHATISIRKREEQVPDEPVETEKEPDMATPFTDDELQKAWIEFTDTIPKEPILVNTMKMCLPQTGQDYTLHVAVPNSEQLKRLNDKKPEILAFLKNRLSNTRIKINITEAEATEKQRIFSPRDKLEYMVGKNPGITELCKDFGLELT